MSRVQFAHASEAELARLFDFYRIDWEYEPRSFPDRVEPSADDPSSFSHPIFTCPNTISTSK